MVFIFRLLGSVTAASRMKVYVKKLNAKEDAIAVTIDEGATIAQLKERICSALNVLSDNVRLLYQGHPLSDANASLQTYGIEADSKINIVYTPTVDMNSTVPKALSSILHNQLPPNILPQIAEQYQIILAKKVKSFSLEDLERYAKLRNEQLRQESCA